MAERTWNVVFPERIDRRADRTAWARQASAFTERYLRENLRDRIGIFWSFLFPTIWYVLTVRLGLAPGFEAGVVPSGKAVLGLSFGVFGAFTVTMVGFSGQLAADLDARRYRKFRSLPLSPSADIAGRFLGGALLGALSFSTVLLVATVDGAVYRLRTPASIAVVLLAVGSFCLVGMVVGLLTTLAVPRPEHATTVGTGVLIVVFFVTGFNGLAVGAFPMDAGLLNLLPNSLATRIAVYHLTDVHWAMGGLSPPAQPDSLHSSLLMGGYALALSAVGVAAIGRFVYASDAGE